LRSPVCIPWGLGSKKQCEEVYHTRMKEQTYKVLLELIPVNFQDKFFFCRDQRIEWLKRLDGMKWFDSKKGLDWKKRLDWKKGLDWKKRID